MEQEALIHYLRSLLLSPSIVDLEGGFHEGVAPTNTCYPYISIQIVDGTDVDNTCEEREFSVVSVLLKVWDEGNQRKRVGRVYKVVDKRLQGHVGTQAADDEAGLPSCSILGISRRKPFKTKETNAGKTYHALGGYYTCWIRCDD
jgi:hypothetical protein